MTDPTKIVKTKLFIGNLDPGTQPDELTELCSPYGTVLEASVIKDYGFVHYGSMEEAGKAAYALNNRDFHGKRLRVELSTSTVRHKPGQPEPASALKHSRGRSGQKGNSNGASRYSSGAPSGGGGPMRHGSLSWARNDARPYSGYPANHGAYDRLRPYDMRPDSRHYYDDRRESSYDPPAYFGGSNSDLNEGRHYRDLPHPDDYGSSRSYDRHPAPPPIDPYYSGGLPHGPPPPMDHYQNYDPYQKYYASRPRDPEYPGQRDYDPYPNYRNGPGQLRHDLPVNLPPPPPLHSTYSSSHRQHHSYGNASSNLDHYYGARQR
ncbi:unnamed protein product [Adineta ricciae]|uniref:RRM domain-containing protein n=1 Tax=Adineta ricciae TaxID=249248 RepID=A0A814XTS1_ADIRI|nr:unnamed protein product [Adineta ricciae]CAF1283709.1 unnamed protein product [Adineta ricciae]